MKLTLKTLSNGNWNMKHQMSVTSTFNGSSPAMETGATVLWERSIATHNLWYRWMTCDGDSKARGSVEEAYTDAK